MVTADSDWKGFYRVGGAAALVAAAFAVIQIIIEIIGVSTTGPPPTTISGWFTLLQSNRLLGLTELTMFQIPAFVLLVPIYLALYAALRRTSQTYVTIATALAFVGIAVYLATNTVFSMLSLSDQYAAATTDAQRSLLLAAGQAMSAISVTSVEVGLSLMSVAGLMISSVMLQSNVFSRVAAYAGILASVTELAYYPSLVVPATGILFLEVSGVFLLMWLLLVGRRLLQLEAGSLEIKMIRQGEQSNNLQGTHAGNEEDK